ncbi:iron-siderophore ABC transporter substrate-binding protein [Microcella daejeonensis]|uniref:Iron-siderophore ABC transporter substrate-binding protein n=1 Tax=Microcella daejeonensis TaxID=2994971 RepID=A0A9E8S9U1_9MICO|nr:iron-siderophore ABC transporter substrate-binding protein [Microcella daejeonensis]WAB82399.1 iron-siderophore ABC transporter substrate-binding protein [Microcella daejeonensis]
MLTPVRRAAAALIAVAAITLAGCSTAAETDTGSTGADDAAFPVTLSHAFGETEITEAPERVVTWGWATADAAIALGVTPVAMPFQAYGGDEEGILPWVAEALEESGDETPTILTNTGSDIPFEEIAAADPDVILAQYSGITEEQYDTLSEIAPVVAYPDQPWSTPWKDIVTITGEALGRQDEAATVLADIEQQIADAAAAHPEFEGLMLATAWDSAAGTFYVYADEDPRVEFMLDLGFVNAPAVDELDTDESPFYFTLSYERVSELVSDVLVVYGANEAEADLVTEGAYAASLPAVQEGAVARLIGEDFISSVSPPTALSLSWGLDEVVDQLAAAVAARG